MLDRGLLQLVIHERRALRFDNLPQAKEHLDVEVVPGGGPKANESWLGVPMLYGEEVLGAIVVGSYQPSAFDAGHQQTRFQRPIAANPSRCGIDNPERTISSYNGRAHSEPLPGHLRRQPPASAVYPLQYRMNGPAPLQP